MQNAYDCRWVPLAERAVGLPTASSPTPARTSGGVRWSACVCSEGKTVGCVCVRETGRESERREAATYILQLRSDGIHLILSDKLVHSDMSGYSATHSVFPDWQCRRRARLSKLWASIVAQRDLCTSHVQHSAVLYPTTFQPPLPFPKKMEVVEMSVDVPVVAAATEVCNDGTTAVALTSTAGPADPTPAPAPALDSDDDGGGGGAAEVHARGEKRGPVESCTDPVADGVAGSADTEVNSSEGGVVGAGAAAAGLEYTKREGEFTSEIFKIAIRGLGGSSSLCPLTSLSLSLSRSLSVCQLWTPYLTDTSAHRLRHLPTRTCSSFPSTSFARIISAR
jgi:hypothetical protein